MTWDHRVVRQIVHGEEWFGIHEAFYSLEGKTVWTEKPVGVVGESIDELRETLERMMAALDRPVIDEMERSRSTFVPAP